MIGAAIGLFLTSMVLICTAAALDAGLWAALLTMGIFCFVGAFLAAIIGSEDW